MPLKSILNYSSLKIYSRYGVNTLGPLCLWQCFCIKSDICMRFIFPGPRKPALYNWHFHFILRTCTTRVVTGTRARLNGVEKRSNPLDSCYSISYLLTFIISQNLKFPFGVYFGNLFQKGGRVDLTQSKMILL